MFTHLFIHLLYLFTLFTYFIHFHHSLTQSSHLYFLYSYRGDARTVATPGDGVTLSKGSYNRLSMNGKEVYKFATREVPRVINEALDAAGMTVDDVDHLLLHQVRTTSYCL